MRKLLRLLGTALLILLAAVLILTACGRLTGRSNLGTRLFETLSAPVEKLISAGIRGLETRRAALRDYEALLAENDALRAEIAEMEAEVRDSRSANEENERLRSLLGLKQSHLDYDLLDAEIISWGSSGWSSTFSVGVGSASGAEVGDCVITETGCLVGVITEAGLYSSSVRTLIDPNSAVGAILSDSGLTGVAEGSFAWMGDGLLKLSYLSGEAEPAIGDTVLTSGAGEVYPAGLVIGRLTELTEEDGGYTLCGIITPAVRLGSLTQVFIIRSFEAQSHED